MVITVQWDLLFVSALKRAYGVELTFGQYIHMRKRRLYFQRAFDKRTEDGDETLL